MKKQLLILVLLTPFFLHAQRYIDLAASSWQVPDTIFYKKSMPYCFTVKNLGPDTLFAGDSIAYRVGIDFGDPNMTMFPDDVHSYYYRLDSNIIPDDTSDWICNTIPKLNIVENRYRYFELDALPVNTSINNPIQDENNSDLGNNSFIKKIHQRAQVYGVGLIPPNNIQNEILLYPNPCTYYFNIENIKENSLVNIYTATGQLHKTFYVSTNSTNINTADWANGFYTLQIINENYVNTKKILISKQ